VTIDLSIFSSRCLARLKEHWRSRRERKSKREREREKADCANALRKSVLSITRLASLREEIRGARHTICVAKRLFGAARYGARLGAIENNSFANSNNLFLYCGSSKISRHSLFRGNYVVEYHCNWLKVAFAG